MCSVQLQVKGGIGIVIAVPGIEEVTDGAEGITAAGVLAGAAEVGCGPLHGACCMHFGQMKAIK